MAAAEIRDEMTKQGALALTALQEYSERKRGKLLFSDQEAAVFLLAKYKRMPMDSKTFKRKIIELPAPDRNASNSSICLIVPDYDWSNQAAKDPDVDRQAREWADHLAVKFGILQGKHYAKIFTMKQLEREYSQLPDRKKLASAYDIFMVDRKLMLKVNGFMGKNFYRGTKRPLPFNSCRGDFTKTLEWAYRVSQIVLTPMTDTVTIRIGNLNQPLDQLESNLKAVANSLLRICPGGPINVRSCYLQSMETSLPIYVDFGSPNAVHKIDYAEMKKI